MPLKQLVQNDFGALEQSVTHAKCMALLMDVLQKLAWLLQQARIAQYISGTACGMVEHKYLLIFLPLPQQYCT